MIISRDNPLIIPAGKCPFSSFSGTAHSVGIHAEPLTADMIEIARKETCLANDPKSIGFSGWHSYAIARATISLEYAWSNVIKWRENEGALSFGLSQRTDYSKIIPLDIDTFLSQIANTPIGQRFVLAGHSVHRTCEWGIRKWEEEALQAKDSEAANAYHLHQDLLKHVWKHSNSPAIHLEDALNTGIKICFDLGRVYAYKLAMTPQELNPAEIKIGFQNTLSRIIPVLSSLHMLMFRSFERVAGHIKGNPETDKMAQWFDLVPVVMGGGIKLRSEVINAIGHDLANDLQHISSGTKLGQYMPHNIGGTRVKCPIHHAHCPNGKLVLHDLTAWVSTVCNATVFKNLN
jgi:hypothetical protein